MGKSSTRQTQSQTFRPTYEDPRAQGGLDALLREATGEGGEATDLSNFYRSQINAPGGNPYLENVISTNDAVANKTFRDRLAQVRSGGFRGGIGRDTINQGQFITDFTNTQARDNARLRYDDYNTGQGYRFNAASGLGGLGTNRAGAATSLLAALRGGASEGTGRTTESGLSFGDLLSGLSGFAGFFKKPTTST